MCSSISVIKIFGYKTRRLPPYPCLTSLLLPQVRVSELWLGTCLEDVAETTKSHDTSFVMGWPTTNVVASFR